MLLEELDTKEMAKKVAEAEVALDKDIEYVKNINNALSWNDLAASHMKQLVDNLWELKEEAVKYNNDVRLKRRKVDLKIIKYSNKVIVYYNVIRHKLNRLKTEIIKYNKKFPNNQIDNIEELINSKIKSSIITLKEQIIALSKI